MLIHSLSDSFIDFTHESRNRRVKLLRHPNPQHLIDGSEEQALILCDSSSPGKGPVSWGPGLDTSSCATDWHHCSLCEACMEQSQSEVCKSPGVRTHRINLAWHALLSPSPSIRGG